MTEPQRRAWSGLLAWESPALTWSMLFRPNRWEKPPAKFHGQALERMRRSAHQIDTNPHDPDPTVIAAPRGSAKTSLVQDLIIYNATESVKSGLYTPCLDNPDDMYMTGTDDLASAKMLPIVRELSQNPLIRDYYGIKVVSSSALDIKLSNGYWIAGTGFRGRVRGEHPRRLLLDDPEDLKDVRKQEVRENTQRLYSATIQGMMLPECPTIVIANYIHPRCLLRKLALETSPGKRLVRGMLYVRTSDGTPPRLARHLREDPELLMSLWPARFSVEWLLAKWRADGDAVFLTEWQNLPQMNTSSPIQEAWIHYYSSKEREKVDPYWWRGLKIVTFADLANSENEKACYTAIVTVGLDYTSPIPRMYVLDARRGRWRTCAQVLEQMNIPYRKYKIAHPEMQYERNNFTNWIEEDYRHRASVDLDIMPLAGVPHDRYGPTKMARLAATAQAYREDMIYFDKDDVEQRIVVDEVLLFPDEFMDYADALTGAIHHLKQFLWTVTVDLRDDRPQDRKVRHPYTGALVPTSIVRTLR